ncbi:MAG: hypothetical protein ACI3XQ_12415 [Eubacteriales bacterium]
MEKQKTKRTFSKPEIELFGADFKDIITYSNADALNEWDMMSLD